MECVFVCFKIFLVLLSKMDPIALKKKLFVVLNYF